MGGGEYELRVIIFQVRQTAAFDTPQVTFSGGSATSAAGDRAHARANLSCSWTACSLYWFELGRLREQVKYTVLTTPARLATTRPSQARILVPLYPTYFPSGLCRDALRCNAPPLNRLRVAFRPTTRPTLPSPSCFLSPIHHSFWVKLASSSHTKPTMMHL